MKLRKIFLTAALVLIGLTALVYVNRLYLLQYSLGWYTDIKHPRDANRAVPWAQGPASAALPV